MSIKELDSFRFGLEVFRMVQFIPITLVVECKYNNLIVVLLGSDHCQCESLPSLKSRTQSNNAYLRFEPGISPGKTENRDTYKF